MLPGLGGQLDEIVVSLIGDCVGKQALQAVPVLAGAGDGGLNLESIATELLTALVGSMLIAILPFALRLRSPRSPTDVAALDALKAGARST
jgi:hypothetical protein